MNYRLDKSQVLFDRVNKQYGRKKKSRNKKFR